MIYPINLAISNNRRYHSISQNSNTKISFGELDDGGDDKYSYYSPKTSCGKESKEYKRARIEAEYNKKFSELCKTADEIEMDSTTFWKLEKQLSAQKAYELDCLNN